VRSNLKEQGERGRISSVSVSTGNRETGLLYLSEGVRATPPETKGTHSQPLSLHELRWGTQELPGSLNSTSHHSSPYPRE